MSKFVYKGPPSAVGLIHEGKTTELMLRTGKEVDLPDGHEVTVSLLAMGYLEVVVEGKASPALPATQTQAPVGDPQVENKKGSK